LANNNGHFESDVLYIELGYIIAIVYFKVCLLLF